MYNITQHHQNSARMKFTDHKTITCLKKHCEHAKKELTKDGITDSFFMVSDFGGRIALSYEYKYPDGFAINCKRIIPTGDIK
jgi:hypothetical protein